MGVNQSWTAKAVFEVTYRKIGVDIWHRDTTDGATELSMSRPGKDRRL